MLSGGRLAAAAAATASTAASHSGFFSSGGGGSIAVNNNGGGCASAQASFRRSSNPKSKPGGGGGGGGGMAVGLGMFGQGSSGRTLFSGTFRLVGSTAATTAAMVGGNNYNNRRSVALERATTTCGGGDDGGRAAKGGGGSRLGQPQPSEWKLRRRSAAAFFLPLFDLDTYRSGGGPPNHSPSAAAAATAGGGGGGVGFFLRSNSQGNSAAAQRNNSFCIQGRFTSSEPGSDDGNESFTPLITKLDKYTAAELKEYRQIFNMFDADRSGAIGLDELENAITNLGMDPKQIDVEMLMREADKRGNQQIDFDEFCEVMKTTSEKTQSWNEVIKECFIVFDRTECGFISRKDFDYVLRELGDIQNSRLVEEIFAEYDVDNNGLIDFDEFSFLVKNYLTDEDVV